MSFLSKFCFLILFSILPSVLFSKDTIYWYHPIFPPINIVHGEYKEKGILDNINTKIFSHLKEYKHQKVIANFKRTIQSIAQKKNVCASGLLWNKLRATHVEFSVAHSLSQLLSLIIKKENLYKYETYKTSEGTYKLENILKDNSLFLGYSLGRAYSKNIDAILQKNISKGNSIGIGQHTVLKALLQMLHKGRIDYTIGYSYEMSYVASEFNLKSSYISLPIHNANELIPVYVGCPKNDWGKNIIKKLNPYILKNRLSKKFYSSSLRWMQIKDIKKFPSKIKLYFNKLKK